MSMVIVSPESKKLKDFLKADKRQYFYLIGSCCDDFGIESFFRERNYKKLDIDQDIENINFIKEYIDFIGRLNREYNSIYWWANSISHKGTFVSNFRESLYYYWRITAFIAMQPHSNYIILNNDSILNSCIKKYCIKNRIDCKLMDANRAENSITYFKRCLLSSLYFIYDGWKRKMLIFVYLAIKIKKFLKKYTPYYILKSWLQKRSFSTDADYRDLFFGRLPEYLKQKNKEFVILAGILNDYKQLILKIRQNKDFLIIPQEYFAGYLDYIKVIVCAFIHKPKIIKKILFCGVDVKDLLIQHLRKDYENNEIGKNLLYYFFVKGLIKKLKVKTFIYTFENQAWEKMSIFAFKRFSPSTSLTGYVHSSIKESWMSYYYSKDEQGTFPLPERILTTGSEPKMILETAGSYTEDVDIVEGCALRYEYIFNKKKIERKKNGKIMVALSIEIDVAAKMLRFLSDAFAKDGRYQVIFRAHSSTPLGFVIKKCNIHFGDNIIISNKSRIEQDLNESSILIYTDSTASVEALMCGIPGIYIDFKETISRDPLFKLQNFKWSASNEDELYRIIDYIYNMDDQDYLKEYSSAMSYLKRYFYPVKEEYLNRFI